MVVIHLTMLLVAAVAVLTQSLVLRQSVSGQIGSLEGRKRIGTDCGQILDIA